MIIIKNKNILYHSVLQDSYEKFQFLDYHMFSIHIYEILLLNEQIVLVLVNFILLILEVVMFLYRFSTYEEL